MEGSKEGRKAGYGIVVGRKWLIGLIGIIGGVKVAQSVKPAKPPRRQPRSAAGVLCALGAVLEFRACASLKPQNAAHPL